MPESSVDSTVALYKHNPVFYAIAATLSRQCESAWLGKPTRLSCGALRAVNFCFRYVYLRVQSFERWKTKVTVQHSSSTCRYFYSSRLYSSHRARPRQGCIGPVPLLGIALSWYLLLLASGTPLALTITDRELAPRMYASRIRFRFLGAGFGGKDRVRAERTAPLIPRDGSAPASGIIEDARAALWIPVGTAEGCWIDPLSLSRPRESRDVHDASTLPTGRPTSLAEEPRSFTMREAKSAFGIFRRLHLCTHLRTEAGVFSFLRSIVSVGR